MTMNLDIFGGLAGIGVMIAGFGFAYSQFKSGAGKAKDDLIQTLKETAEAERVERARLAAEKTVLINSHQEQINQLNEKMGKLQGLYEASERSKQEYLAILQGRDPEQKKFMEETLAILKSMQQFLDTINKTTAFTKKFQEEIADDTKKGKGKVLKKDV